MNLHSRLLQHKPLLDCLAAKREDSLGFADLLWPPLDAAEFFDRVIHQRDMGVRFTTASRIFVLEEHSGELRFYAGPWHDAIYLNDPEPNELGTFPSVGDALEYAVAFLVEGRHPSDIDVPRGPRAGEQDER